jgi:serine/threonine-protein kinase
MSSPAPAPVETIPTVGGNYRLLERIGQGGMGIVYRGEQCALGRTVAIKLLHPELAAIPELVQRFHLEARAASRLAHPGSVAVYDYGITRDGTPFMVMEYVPGQTLARLIRERWPVALASIVDLGQQILGALAEAHASGVVHGDIKSDNVLVETGRDGDHAKLVDYGLARLLDDVGAIEDEGVCGTPEYMAPEVASGDPATPVSDLYSVGALLYEMITGAPPFVARTPQEVLHKQVGEQVVPPSERRPERAIPMGFEAVIMRALAKDPADRFRDAAQFIHALERVRPAVAAPPPAATVLPAPGFLELPTRSWDATELGRTKTRLARGTGAPEPTTEAADARPAASPPRPDADADADVDVDIDDEREHGPTGVPV